MTERRHWARHASGLTIGGFHEEQSLRNCINGCLGDCDVIIVRADTMKDAEDLFDCSEYDFCSTDDITMLPYRITFGFIVSSLPAGDYVVDIDNIEYFVTCVHDKNECIHIKISLPLHELCSFVYSKKSYDFDKISPILYKRIKSVEKVDMPFTFWRPHLLPIPE